MAYQNVGTPRFYVDILQWLKAQGLVSVQNTSFAEDVSFIMDLIGINPTSIIELSGGDGSNNTIRYNTTHPLKDLMPNDKNFAMALGHNFGTAESSFYTAEGEGTTAGAGTNSTWTSVASTGYVNSTSVGSGGNIDYDGFSIHIGNDAHNIQTNIFQFRFDYQGDGNVYNDNPIKIGSLLYGTYYDMPHSPDLSLKLSYEYDGVKTQQTKGGATLSNALYTKPADWGDYGAWQLGIHSALESNLRSGRRVWDLSFSYLSDTDVFPVNANRSYVANVGSETGYGDVFTTDEYDNYLFNSNVLTGTDFFSQVWNKTMGGHLAFIFNPSGGGTSPNNNPDQFAICRFDMDSLQYDQVAHNTYNVKLKIRESW